MDVLEYWKTCIESYVLSDEEAASEDNSQILVSTTQESHCINGFTSVTDESESSIDELECNVSIRLKQSENLTTKNYILVSNSHTSCQTNYANFYLHQIDRQNSKFNGRTTHKTEEYQISNSKHNLIHDINIKNPQKEHSRKCVCRKDTRRSPVSSQSEENYRHLDLQIIKETWFDLMDDSSDSSDDEAFQRCKPQCADTYRHVNNRPGDNQKRQNVELTHSCVKFRNPSISSTDEESSGFWEDYSEITSFEREELVKAGISTDSIINESKIGFGLNRWYKSDWNHEQQCTDMGVETVKNNKGRQPISLNPSTGFGYNKWFRPETSRLFKQS